MSHMITGVNFEKPAVGIDEDEIKIPISKFKDHPSRGDHVQLSGTYLDNGLPVSHEAEGEVVKVAPSRVYVYVY